MDEWFNRRLKEQLKRSLDNDPESNISNEGIAKINKELKIANEKTTQHKIFELAN